MYHILNFLNNDNIRIVNEMGPFTVVEYLRDLSVSSEDAMTAYYCNQMNIRKRQVICDMSKANITVQRGAMQWMAGNVNATTGIKGVGDFFGKTIRGKVTGETTIKPEYTGNGIMKRLMIQGLTQMHKEGKSFALLYPYSIPLYHHLGWEIISNKISYNIKESVIDRSRRFWPVQSGNCRQRRPLSGISGSG